jgi:hypothetical protein
MSKAALLALADRVQALTGPCRETDSAVSIALFPDQHALVDLVRGQMSSWWAMINCITRYTASLDAAMTLVPEWWSYQAWQGPSGRPHEWLLRTIRDGDKCYTEVNSKAATPAIALTAAALRAIAAQMPDGG